MQQIAFNLNITGFFAALLAMFYVKLTLDIIKIRQNKKIPVGDGGDESLARARAAHENFAHNSLFFILLLAIAEFEQVSAFLLIVLGLVFMAARTLHAHSVKVYEKQKKSYGLRALAVMTTFGVILALAVINLYNSLF
jgi:uncharacterized membrane protein YecN with MAPEG domain